MAEGKNALVEDPKMFDASSVDPPEAVQRITVEPPYQVVNCGAAGVKTGRQRGTLSGDC
jgi:hypothetical protein